MVASGRVALRPLAAALAGVGRAAAPHATTPTPPEDTVSRPPRRPRHTPALPSISVDPEAMAWRLAARLADAPGATIATPRTRGR